MLSGCAVGQSLTKYVAQIDARLCPRGQIPSLDAILDPPIYGREHIKTCDVIDVYRVQWAGCDVVVKRYNHLGFVHSLRHTVKGSRARRGWRNGQRLLELGIPTPRPIACIDEYWGPLLWRSWLITEYVDVPTLYEILADECVPAGRKRRLVHQTLGLIDRLASHGISHGDMKHSNILCDAGKVVLTDLDGMRIHASRLAAKWRRRRDVKRFLRGMHTPQKPISALGTLVRHWGSYRRRLRRDFDELESSMCRLVIRKTLRNDAFERALLGEAAGLRERYAAAAVRSGASSRVCHFPVVLSGAARKVYHKEYLRRSSLDSWKSIVRGSRARRAFRGAAILADHGFGTPEIVAMGENRPACLGRGAFLVTLDVADARHLYQLARDYAVGLTKQRLREKRELLESLGRTIGRLHRAGIFHGDLRLGNVLARQEHDTWCFFFIDNERTGRFLRLPTWLRVKNIVQANMLQWPCLTTSDRMRFFRAYLTENPELIAERDTWIAKIVKKTDQRLKRRTETQEMKHAVCQAGPSGSRGG